MRAATRARQSTFDAADGSRTQTITNDPTREEDEDDQGLDPEEGQVVGSLRLRGGRRTQRVVWGEDVIDNEGCGKKKSKICCIYHKPRRFDESSDESSDSDSDDDCAHHNHNHDHSAHGGQPAAGPSSHAQQVRPDVSSTVVHEIERQDDVEPNAYEKQPLKKGKHRAA